MMFLIETNEDDFRQPSQNLVITVTSQWARWRLKLRLLIQPFVQTQIKENVKAPHHWPLWGKVTGTGEFPAQRASNAENVSIWWRHHEDVNRIDQSNESHNAPVTW